MSPKHIENNAARATAASKYILFAVNAKDGALVLNAMLKHGINYKVAEGYYNGEREDCFIVNVDQWDAVYKYLWWAISTQDSILHLGPVDRKQDARPVIQEYINITRPPLFLGYFWAVSDDTAAGQDAWTKDAGQCYVAAFHKPDHIPGPLDDYDNKVALNASHDSVRRSNEAAVAHHRTKSLAAGPPYPLKVYDIGPERVHCTPHHAATIPWTGGRPIKVKGTFTDRGACTPSGHEF